MKNLCVVALMAAAAVNVLSAWALPLPPSTENYCPASAIAADLDLNANVSNRVYRSGSGCAVGANVLLNITAQNIAFEYISPDPTTIEFTDSSVGAAGAVDIRAPDFGFSGMMVPLIVRVLNNQFAKNAVLHLHGCFPYNSVVTISGNTFAETSARNFAVDASVGVAAISLGVTDDKFQNPLLFLPYTEVLISDNVIRNVVGAMGVETAGIAVIPSSFFMGNNTKFAIRNNVVETATGVSTNPVIPYSLKGFINVIPEYDGHHDAYFEFSGNTAPAVTNGIAWWMPGMWGPRGAHDLAINVTDNSAAISTVVGNDRYAAVHSTVNCTARGKFYYERNEISVTNTDQTPTIIFYPMLSEGQFVAIRDNTFSVNGAAAAINTQPWTGLGEAHVSGNRVTSVTGEATWRVSGINGTAANVQFSDNTVDGTSVVCNFVDVSLLGGSVSLDSFVLSSRGNPVAINFGNVSLSNGAQLGVTRWAVTSFTSITFNMAGAVDLADDGTSFTFSGNNLTSSNGAAIVVLGRPTLSDASQIVVSTNRIRASGGSPNLRFNDLYVADNAAVLLSFNNLVRTDSSAMTSSYFIINGALSLLDNAEFGMWNNTMNAVNTGTIVGILQVIANFTASPNADVFICKNIYYPSAANLNVNQTLQMQLVVPAQLGALSKCDRFTTTPAPTTTATTTTRRPTTTQAATTTETETDDANATTTESPFPTGSNGAASRAVAAAVAIAAAVVCAALL